LLEVSLENVETGNVMTITSSVIALNTLFFFEEMIQSNFFMSRNHFRIWWNVLDLGSIILVYSYIILVNFEGVGNISAVMAVVTTLFLTLKLIAYLRGFDMTGWLVSVLIQNIVDMRGFIIIMLAILIGFTTIFRLVFSNVKGCAVTFSDTDQLIEECDNDQFSSFLRSLLSTFELTILGTYEPSLLTDSKYPEIAVTIFVLAVIIILVIALNTLIAILGDSFSRVQENSTANRRRERAELIVEYFSMMPAFQRDRIEKKTKYIHALLETDADGDLLIQKDDWHGGLNSLKRDLIDINLINNEAAQHSIESLRTDLTHEINSLKFDVTLILNEISVELKEMTKTQQDGGITINNKNVKDAVKAVRGIGRNLTPFGNGRLQLLPGFIKKARRSEANEG